jgi:hypothetical protein
MRVSKTIPVYPIGYVEGAIRAESGEVVCRYSLRFTRPLEHEQLGQYGNRLKEDGKRPQNLR